MIGPLIPAQKHNRVRAWIKTTETLEASAPASALELLRLTVWCGFVTGFLELLCMLVRCNFTDPNYYNVSRHYIWMYPLAGLIVFSALGGPLVLAASLRPGRIARVRAWAYLLFFMCLGVLIRWPLYTLACMVLAAGLAVQTARFLVARTARVERFVHGSLAGLVGLFAVLVVVSFSRQAVAERRALAALPAAPPKARNVLLVVLDTVRADCLSAYGYNRETSPTLARLARRGIRFEHAQATAPWTTPSHASMFTGRWAHDLSAGWKTPLDGTHPTLAEFLSTRGYATAGFVANTYYCSYETGLNRGFAHYEDYDVTARQVVQCSALVQRGLTIARSRLNLWLDDVRQPNVHRKSASRINTDFLRWLDRRDLNRPFFAFLNFYDAHHPYLVSGPDDRHFGRQPESRSDFVLLRTWWDADKHKLSPAKLELVRDAYDDGLAALDRQLDCLFQALDERHLLENTMVIVTSDHGEHLGEQRLFCHGCSLYQPELHVPLLAFAPSRVPAGRSVPEPVSLRDLPATVVDLLGLADRSPFPGHSLARFWEPETDGVRSTSDEPLLSEVETPPGSDPNGGRSPVNRGRMQSLVSGSLHYIRNGDGREELYDLAADPTEQRDIAASAGSRGALERMRTQLAEVLRDDTREEHEPLRTASARSP
ncbi:MAG TPA: sulfatase [Isosphaeraceae bacterium]|jgi:arylsulfatase A-like enzyme|nr:sulfatase [Isosphaeraceae bacterium]